jgi:hypothetical protein
MALSSATASATQSTAARPLMLFRARKQAAAELALLIDQYHPCPAAPGGEGRGKSRRSSTDHKHIAMRIASLVTIGIGRHRRTTQSGSLANVMLIGHPQRLRPHEGLVVEPGRQQPAEPAVDYTDIMFQGWPAIDRGGRQVVIQLGLRGAGIGHRVRTFVDLEDGIGFLGAAADDAPRPMVLEASPHQVHAVGKQRGGECVTGEAGQAAPLKSELKRTITIDASARWEAVGLAQASTSGRSSSCR